MKHIKTISFGMKHALILLFALLMATSGCKNSAEGNSSNAASDTTSPQVIHYDSVYTNDSSQTVYDPATTNKETAQKIIDFLTAKYKADLSYMTEKDREFSFYELDLNDDNKNEYFIYQQGGYFCGSGGCSFYLLNNDFSINTYLSVTNPPIFRSSAVTNGWHDLILFGDYSDSGGVKNYTHLKFDKTKNKYPSNPSLVKKVETAPGGHDLIMWSDDYSRAKVYSF